MKALKRGEPGQAYERFSREVSAIKKLQHPNIIKIVDSSSPGDKFQFYVMEYIDGASPLEKIIKSDHNPYLANPLKSLWLFIESGYPPLEEIGPRCPVCGVGELSDFQGSHMVFGNPNPRPAVTAPAQKPSVLSQAHAPGHLTVTRRRYETNT